MATTFCEKLIEAAEARPDKVAMTLLGAQVEETTFSEMLARFRSIAYRLAQENIAPGDRVAIIGENHPNWVVAYLGILYRGAVAVPLDPSAKAETLANFVNNSDAKLAFVSPSSLDKFHEICDRLGKQIPAVALRPLASSNGLGVFEDWANTKTTLEFNAQKPPAKLADVAVLIYTSGTTGTPKAVQLTHGNIFSESEGVQEAMKISEHEVVLSLLPMFHSYSQVVNLWVATTIGLRVVYITELNPEEIVRGLKEGQVTTLTGVPRLFYLFHKKIFDAVRTQPKPVQLIFKSLLVLNGWLRDYLNVNAGMLFFKKVHDGFGGKLRLTISAGSSFDASVANDYHRLGFTILQGYGLSETSGAATATRFEDNKVGSVGTPLGDTEVKIAEPNSEGIGEVMIRGSIVMPGYYNNPEANREAFTEDGWFLTGDLGRFDKQNHLYIVGRKKDVIILPSGKNVYPEDVEAHYAKTSVVGEICVLGVKDEVGEFAGAEKLCAIVVPDFDYLKANHISNTRELIRWELDGLGRELPEYQRVRDYIVRTEPLPRTATRKIKRFELKQQIEDSGVVARQTRDAEQFVLTDEDRALLDSPAGKAVITALKQNSHDADVIHPQMNLELDLGLDSLARAEAHVNIEQALGIELEPQAAAAALTAGEIIRLAQVQIPSGNFAVKDAANTRNWQEILNDTTTDNSELQAYLQPRPWFTLLAYLGLRGLYFAARVLLRLEVKGLENITSLRRPFLICPNHQSYLDAFLVSATYPLPLLQQIFHVGWSEFFKSALMTWVAKLMHVVPVDPDTKLLRAMRAGAIGLRANKILNIYPEGERSFDGVLHPFRKGAAILATELNVPIVPVALDGLWQVWGRGSARIRFTKVKIHFGTPITANSALQGEAQYEALTATVKQQIQQMLEDMRRRCK